MFAGLFILWAKDTKINREQVLHGLLAFFLAQMVAEIIKILVPTPRPFIVNGLIPLTTIIPTDGAFPSGHAASSFALATTIWLHDRKVGWFYLASAIVIGAARVAANVHYPVDILGGAIIGILIAFLIEKIHINSPLDN